MLSEENLETDTEREGDVKTQGEDSHLGAQDRGQEHICSLQPQEKPTPPTPELRLPVSRISQQ
jgi:hypothetical protein